MQRRNRAENESSEMESNDLPNKHTPNDDDIDIDNDDKRDKDMSKDKDNKSETTGRSIASRFRRNKKLEEKPTDEEQEPLNGRFGGRDRDSRDRDNRDRDGRDDRESRGHGDSGSKEASQGHSHSHSADSGDAAGSSSHQAASKKEELNQLEKDLELGPLRVLEPIRTDPVLLLKTRQKRLERLTAEFVPEIHIIGNILSGSGIVQEQSEGASCRYCKRD
jgi:hypothetical protein